jgi:hypothetical protein
MKQEELKSEIQKACDKFWESHGAKFGKIQTIDEFKKRDGYKEVTNLDILIKKPETKFLVKGTTLRTRGFEMVCELDIQLFKPDGSKRRGENVFASVWLGSILNK